MELASAGVTVATKPQPLTPCATASDKHCKSCSSSRDCWINAGSDNPGIYAGTCSSDINSLTCYNQKCVYSDSDSGCGIPEGDQDAFPTPDTGGQSSGATSQTFGGSDPSTGGHLISGGESELSSGGGSFEDFNRRRSRVAFRA
ncbi:hypothetical protein LEL_08950 [Akanthomyces lecanii RCEF 1005]|uniref:Uncharacterized protein n=1 Tax=Akanthomyces lecanii RCEF 1005 TaxID=1081108 RepID=A0A168CRW8_CORDF|nr:hypothetical protein LEL_08950 [Akanthomyces lecanii RCEF 1005]